MFSARLKELRQKKNISQNRLGEKIGFSQQAVAKWETDRATPSPETLASIAMFFDVSTDYLIGVTDNPAPQSKKKPAENGELEADKKELHEIIERLRPSDREAVLQFARFQESVQNQ